MRFIVNFSDGSVVSVIVYITTYYTLRQKEIYPLDEQQRKELLAVELEEDVPGEKKKLLTDAEFEVFKQRLLVLMETERPYLDGELKLIKLANQMNMNPHQLSYLINNGFNENFFQFVNKYRVDQTYFLWTRISSGKCICMKSATGLMHLCSWILLSKLAYICLQFITCCLKVI